MFFVRRAISSAAQAYRQLRRQVFIWRIVGDDIARALTAERQRPPPSQERLRGLPPCVSEGDAEAFAHQFGVLLDAIVVERS